MLRNIRNDEASANLSKISCTQIKVGLQYRFKNKTKKSSSMNFKAWNYYVFGLHQIDLMINQIKI